MRRTLPHPAALAESVRMAVAGRVTLAVIFGLVTLVPALGRVAPVAAQTSEETFTTATAAPADSLAYMVMTLDDQSEQWRLGDELLDRAGIGQALDEELGQELRDETGEELPLDAFLGGEVGVIVGPTALNTFAEGSMGTAGFGEMLGGEELATPVADLGEPQAQGFAVALDARAPETAWTGIRDSIREEQSEESTYEGVTILYAPPASADDQGVAAAQVGQLILIATSPSDLHPLIDTLAGRIPSIMALPEFATVREALPAESLLFAFGNQFDASAADFGPFAMAASELSTEAFSGVTVTAEESGFRVETVALPAEGETLPAAAANYESELLTRAPSETILFMSAPDLGATGVLDIIGATFIGLAMGMGDPTAAPDPDVSVEDYIAEQYAAAESLIGINLQTDLFQQLAGEYGGWLSADPENEVISGLFASGVADPETVSNALMQLSFLIQGASGAESPLTTREVGEGQVYVIELGDEAGSTIEFGVVNDYLVIGSGEAVDRLGEPPAESLADNPQFQAVMDTLPAEYNGLTYIDLAQAIPQVQAAAEESGDLGLGGFDEVPDASESCANYASQEEAQAAYDAAESGTFDLDQDFDGEVCEDFFANASGESETDEDSPEDVAADAADALGDVDYSAIKAFATASYEEDGLNRSSSILYISE